MDNFSNGWTEKIEKLEAEKKQLQNAMQIADQRLVAAAKHAGISYFGCHTPDALADRILELERITKGR